MVERFAFWTTNPFHPTVRLKETYESWPMTLNDPVDETSGFARDWAMRWRDDEFFPPHPLRNAKNGQMILPDSLDQSPLEYLEANEPPAVKQEPDVTYPFSGPTTLVRGPGANSGSTIAAYERSRRGLKRLESKPPVPPYEAPMPAAKGHNPTRAPDPKIPVRVYSRDKFDPKYQKPGANGDG